MRVGRIESGPLVFLAGRERSPNPAVTGGQSEHEDEGAAEFRGQLVEVVRAAFLVDLGSVEAKVVENLGHVVLHVGFPLEVPVDAVAYHAPGRSSYSV